MYDSVSSSKPSSWLFSRMEAEMRRRARTATFSIKLINFYGYRAVYRSVLCCVLNFEAVFLFFNRKAFISIDNLYFDSCSLDKLDAVIFIESFPSFNSNCWYWTQCLIFLYCLNTMSAIESQMTCDNNTIETKMEPKLLKKLKTINCREALKLS